MNDKYIKNFEIGRKLLSARYGSPINEGRHRMVFHDKENNEVIKLPTYHTGIRANLFEAENFNKKSFYAKTKMDDKLSKLLNIPIIRMEYVEEIVLSPEDIESLDSLKPSQKVKNIINEMPSIPFKRLDGLQVGRGKDGKLLFYDFEKET